MLAEWTAECAADAPTIVVPWSDAVGDAHFIHLRTEPYDIVEIAEAEQYPALSRALRSLNAARSAFLTSKCDVWTLDARSAEDEDELAPLRLELNLEPEESVAGTSSYIDVVWRDRTLFGSAHQQQGMLDRLTRRAERLEHAQASLSCVLRPALADFGDTLEGFALTLYVRALAPDLATAVARWSAALEDVTGLLRGRDLAPKHSSATID